MKFYIFLLLIFSSILGWAQNVVDTIPVYENSHRIENPWTGGLNYCQLNDVDLNGDGKLDLVVFDKTAFKLSTFINLGIADSASYVYKPEYISRFPQHLQGWVLLADYNCDGKNDLFTSEGGYIDVYRNDYNTTTPNNYVYEILKLDKNKRQIILNEIPLLIDFPSAVIKKFVSFTWNTMIYSVMIPELSNPEIKSRNNFKSFVS